MADPADLIRPLIRTRQYREFTEVPPTDAEVDAIIDAGRWAGSSENDQPWRLIAIRSRSSLQALAVLGMPQTRSLRTAPVAVAITMPDGPDRSVVDAYDEGRVAERMLIAASMLGLGAGIAWLREPFLDGARDILGLPESRLLRTIVAIGHPTQQARQPKAAPGLARRPRQDVVAEERWPAAWTDEPSA